MRRLLFAVTALALLLALFAARVDFVQDYADLDGGTSALLILEDSQNDAQDNEPFILLEPPRCCRPGLAGAGGDRRAVRPVLAIYSPELHPPALA